MTFKEWLDNQCEKRATKIKDGAMITQLKFDELRLNSGLSLSVQASEFHFCEPRETLENNEYGSVEVYTHGETVTRLESYKSGGHVFMYVPVEDLEEICKENGGITE